MKKLIVTILTVVFALTLALGVVGCGGNGQEAAACNHKLATKGYLKVDKDYHKVKCTICNEYVQEKHKWVQGVDEGDGTKTYNCSKCGDTKSDR